MEMSVQEIRNLMSSDSEVVHAGAGVQFPITSEDIWWSVLPYQVLYRIDYRTCGVE